MELRDLIQKAPKKTLVETYGSGPHAFDVELRLCSRPDIERIANMTVMKKDGRGQWQEKPDPDKVRRFLQEQCIVGWKGLTVATAFNLCNRELENGNGQHASASVAYSADNVALLLEEGVGAEGQMGFMDWVISIVAKRVEEEERRVEQEKKASATTSAATSST